MEKSSAATPSRRAPTRGVSTPRAPSPEHANLWADGPVLRSSGGRYGGRAIVEVWDDGTALSVTNRSGLVPAALTALENKAPVREARVALPPTPMTGPHPGGPAFKFLGRVIVEFWTEGPVVNVFGSDARLLEYATRHLTSLTRPPSG